MSKRTQDDARTTPRDVPVELFRPVTMGPDSLPAPSVPHPSGHPRTTIRQRATKRRAQRADINPHALVRERARALTRAAQKDGYGLPAALSRDQQIRMASELVSQFHREAKGTSRDGTALTANGRKQAAVAFGVCVDKLLVLQSRVNVPVSPEDHEAQRPAILELARRLAVLPLPEPT